MGTVVDAPRACREALGASARAAVSPARETRLPREANARRESEEPHGFHHAEIGDRLKSAWVGEPGQTRIYEDAQHCATLFREFCLDHNLLDFSLQLEIFLHRLWPNSLCQEYLKSEYRHLIFDNLEEDTPVAADLLRRWLPDFDSIFLIYDTDAGYRYFLTCL